MKDDGASPGDDELPPRADFVVLSLKIEHSPNSGLFYVTSDDPRDLLVARLTLAEALAAVPGALVDLRAAGASMPALKGVALP
jgi:hypothetical protein